MNVEISFGSIQIAMGRCLPWLLSKPAMSREPDVDYAAQNEPKGSSEISIILDILSVGFHVFFIAIMSMNIEEIKELYWLF